MSGPAEVIVDFRFTEGLLFVAVANIGQRPALDVTVRFTPAFRGLGGTRTISDLPLFQRLTFLAPGARIEAFLDSAAAYFARGEPERIQVAIAYAELEGRRRETVLRHDLSVYRTLPHLAGPD